MPYLLSLAASLVVCCCASQAIGQQPLQPPHGARIVGAEPQVAATPGVQRAEQPASFEQPQLPPGPLTLPWNSGPDAAQQQRGRDERASNVEQDEPATPRSPAGTLAVRKQGASSEASAPRAASTSLASMLASLCLVLGLIFIAAWLIKRGMPRGARQLPAEVVEVLGRTPLGPRMHVHLLRVGNKMILVSLAGGAAETLTEITDPLEVDRLAGLCQQELPHSSTNAFKQIFHQFARRGDAELDAPLPTLAGELGEVRHG